MTWRRHRKRQRWPEGRRWRRGGKRSPRCVICLRKSSARLRPSTGSRMTTRQLSKMPPRPGAVVGARAGPGSGLFVGGGPRAAASEAASDTGASAARARPRPRPRPRLVRLALTGAAGACRVGLGGVEAEGRSVATCGGGDGGPAEGGRAAAAASRSMSEATLAGSGSVAGPLSWSAAATAGSASSDGRRFACPAAVAAASSSSSSSTSSATMRWKLSRSRLSPMLGAIVPRGAASRACSTHRPGPPGS